LLNKLLRLLVSVALLGWLVLNADWIGQIGHAFEQLHLEWWLAALSLYVASQLISAVRWKLLARPLGFQHTLKQFTGYYFIGMFFNMVLPTSVGGDVVRAWYLDGGTGRKLPAFLSAFMDRFTGLIALIGMACVAMAVCPIKVPEWVAYSVWGTGVCAVSGILLLPVLTRWSSRFSKIRRLANDAALYLRYPGLFVAGIGLSLLVQGANVLIVWMVGQALNMSIPFAYYWISVPMVTLLTLIPVSLNGMGVREGGMVLFLVAPLGIPNSAAINLAFLWFLVFTSASLLGGAVYLFGNFPRPEVQSKNETVALDSDSDQGRAGQLEAAA
jgi:uncharacterized membrane protein YbhN (UPF0104 family)